MFQQARHPLQKGAVLLELGGKEESTIVSLIARYLDSASPQALGLAEVDWKLAREVLLWLAEPAARRQEAKSVEGESPDDYVLLEDLDLAELRRRAGWSDPSENPYFLPGSEHFDLVRCPQCGRIYLFEYCPHHEVVFLDPDDLERYEWVEEPQESSEFACRDCGRVLLSHYDFPGFKPHPEGRRTPPEEELRVSWGHLAINAWRWICRRTRESG
jgi:hypothetical protein